MSQLLQKFADNQEREHEDYSNLSHDEMVSLNLLQALEDKYFELDKEQKDGILMLLIQETMIND